MIRLLPCLLLACAPLAAQEIIESFIARATAQNPRHSEGDVVVLTDGSLLAAWSDFYGGAEDNAAMISHDEGKTWSKSKNLESDPAATYACTSVTFHEGRALLSYYHFSNGGKQLSLRFKSVPLEWFGR